MNLLEKLNQIGNNSKDFDSRRLRFEIIELNGIYKKLSEEAISTSNLEALSILELYTDRRKEFLSEKNHVQYNSDELYF